MPFIQIKIWEGRTKEEKARMAKYITEAVVHAIEVPPEVVTVVFQEVPKENWAVAGKLSSEFDN